MIFFNFYNYLKNPIADFCFKQQKSAVVYTLEDINKFIENLPFTEKMIELGNKDMIGDEFRLYLASQSDDFLYLDLDCFIPQDVLLEIKNIDNCVAFHDNRIIETGTFFHSNKDCDFIHFYLSKYKEKAENNNLKRENVYLKYPFNRSAHKSGDMTLFNVDNKIRHFYLSRFYSFAKANGNNPIYYTYNPNNKITEKNVWVFNTKHEISDMTFSPTTLYWHYSLDYKYIDRQTLFDLFKEQMNFIYQKEMKFIET